MRLEDEVPHIEAQCSECDKKYDMKFDTSCPRCGHVGVKYARVITPEEECRIKFSAARTELRKTLDSNYPGRLSSPYAHTEKDSRDIAELDKMYALDSTGSRP